MRSTKKSLLNILNKNCTKKVRVCTIKFCATGCLDESYDDDDIICLENVEMYFSDGSHEIQHRDSICICDNNIIAFEALKD